MMRLIIEAENIGAIAQLEQIRRYAIAFDGIRVNWADTVPLASKSTEQDPTK